MKVTVSITKNFKAEAKLLLKKYPSLLKDLLQLEKQLINNPKLGTPLGKNTYKIRLKITSKGKGKSGGARVISLLENSLLSVIDVSNEDFTVYLISIYDKADTDTISEKELKELIRKLKEE